VLIFNLILNAGKIFSARKILPLIATPAKNKEKFKILVQKMYVTIQLLTKLSNICQKVVPADRIWISDYPKTKIGYCPEKTF